MIVSCECRSCFIKDLCMCCNNMVGDFESNWGDKFMFITLKCKHLHREQPELGFDCDYCKNRSVCRVHHLNNISAKDYIEQVKCEVKTKCSDKLPINSFYVTIECKGYSKI